MGAESIEGPWVLEDEPLLAAEEDGTWDQYGAQFSELYWDDERLFMLYQSSDSSFQGLAVSEDGVVWRRSLPDGLLGPYPGEGNVIFMERSDGIWFPQVVWRTPEGWQMIYAFLEGQRFAIDGLRSAISTDGVNWEPIDVQFRFENQHGNQTPSFFAPFWVGVQLHIAYCIWDEGAPNCYLARLLEISSE